MSKFSVNTTDSNNKLDNDDMEIDLREILFKYLHHWKWFVISAIVFTAIGAFVYLKMIKTYEVSTSVLLKENSGTGAQKNSPLGSLEELGLLSTTNNVDNEIAVFSSPNLMKQVVLSLELQTSYFEKGLIKNTEAYKESPYYVRLEDVKPEDLEGYLKFDLKKKGEGISIKGEHIMKDNEISFELSIEKLPGFVELPQKLGKLYVTTRPEIEDIEEKLSNDYLIYIKNAQRVAYDLSKEIRISTTTKSSSVLVAKLEVQNISKGIDVLNEMVKTYNENNIQENNEMAANTSIFINDQLRKISAELSEVEDDVVSYKKQQGITDLGSEAKIYVEQTSQIQQKYLEIETQIKTVELVETFIQDTKNSYKLIPNLGITDPGLSALISEYNSLLLEYQRLENSTSQNNPSRRKALLDLDNMKEGIKGAVNNVRRSLSISKRELDKQSNVLTSRISSIPAQERGLLERTRQQEIKQALFIYLMQVNLETGITMASTADKAKVITDPIIPDGPVSPRRNLILLASFLIGLVIPIIVLYIKDLFQLNISNREELEKLSNIPVIGEIMKKEETEVVVVSSNKTTPIVELFRTLRNNIQFMLNDVDKKVIIVTSTIPGEGKTFVSINLAASFALSDKKILLMGMDIRSPKLAEDIGFTKSMGLTSYLSGSEKNWRSLLYTPKDVPNLDILQAGIIPPNPNELLMKPALNKLIEEAKQEYDVVIIDSAPIGVVSDTFLLAPMGNVTIYVTRENVTPKNAVAFINEVYQDRKLPDMYLVINGVEPSKNKGRYGRYGYGNTYGYGEKK
jgi:capsular exopolysaccharide synthesis family protein